MFGWRNCWRISASRWNRFDVPALPPASAVTTFTAAGLPVFSFRAR